MAVDVGAMVFFLYSSYPWFLSLPNTWLDKSKGIIDLGFFFFFWKGLTVRKVKYISFTLPQKTWLLETSKTNCDEKLN